MWIHNQPPEAVIHLRKSILIFIKNYNQSITSLDNQIDNLKLDGSIHEDLLKDLLGHISILRNQVNYGNNFVHRLSEEETYIFFLGKKKQQ